MQKNTHTQTQYSHLHKVDFHCLLFHLQFHFPLTLDHYILKGCLPSLGQTNLARHHLRIQQPRMKGKERINSSCLSEWKISSHVTLLLWGVMWRSYAVFLARRLSFPSLKEGIVLGLSVTGRFDTSLFIWGVKIVPRTLLKERRYSPKMFLFFVHSQTIFEVNKMCSLYPNDLYRNDLLTILKKKGCANGRTAQRKGRRRNS